MAPGGTGHAVGVIPTGTMDVGVDCPIGATTAPNRSTSTRRSIREGLVGPVARILVAIDLGASDSSIKTSRCPNPGRCCRKGWDREEKK